jgi:polar amino acid transport system ATP-binding protein
MIQTRKLVLQHGAHRILNEVDFVIDQGLVAAIIGPSGSGKSTFLRCLNGLDRFQQGEVVVDDLILNASLHRRTRESVLLGIRRRVGMVFQSFNLFPHRTALQNVADSPIHVLKHPPGQARAAALELLQRVGLADRANAYPAQLSGGQQQRVAIARALAMQPRAILFDEPTSALDPNMTREVLSVIADLKHDGLTMIVVTHAMDFARQVADQVHVFDAGRIIESGSPDQILTSPQREVTRNFIRKGMSSDPSPPQRPREDP